MTRPLSPQSRIFRSATHYSHSHLALPRCSPPLAPLHHGPRPLAWGQEKLPANETAMLLLLRRPPGQPRRSIGLMISDPHPLRSNACPLKHPPQGGHLISPALRSSARRRASVRLNPAISALSTAATSLRSRFLLPGTSRSLMRAPAYETRPLMEPLNRLTKSISWRRGRWRGRSWGGSGGGLARSPLAGNSSGVRVGRASRPVACSAAEAAWRDG